MLDFTSSHYLGFWHASRSLRPWMRLTTGVPAALYEPGNVKTISAALAELQGLARATLARSTLHIFWDLFGMFPGEQSCIYIDAQAYPIAHWGAERAAGRGVFVKSFPHRDVNALRSLLSKEKKHLRPVIVTNGICTCCGCTTPLRAYQEFAVEFGGLLIIDDTQALGILG
jgi:8-amino-7-oxononanoate synthase